MADIDWFLAEIRIFPWDLGGIAPKGWATCDGQLLPISQNTALFSLLGTYYGGNGISTFALPNLMGRVPMHPNNFDVNSPLSAHDLGEVGGTENLTLLQSEIPFHSHTLRASNSDGIAQGPEGQLLAAGVGGIAMYADVGNPAPPMTQLAQEALAPVGGSLPHNNMQPYLTFFFCIALQGIFPSR